MKWVKECCKDLWRAVLLLIAMLALGVSFGFGLTLAWHVNQPSVGLVVVQGRAM